MNLKLVANSADPPIGALLTVEYVRSKFNTKIDVTWSKEFPKNSSNLQFFEGQKNLTQHSHQVARYLARTVHSDLYGSDDPFEKTEVDHWLTFAHRPFNNKTENTLHYLDQVLTPRTWLVAKHITIADFCVFSKINTEYDVDFLCEKYPNIFRWYKQILSLPEVQKVLEEVMKNRTDNPKTKTSKRKDLATSKDTGKRKQEGKFIDLPGAEMGKVVVRFPPEASGFLHIGHAKAALLNQYYAENFKGQLIMRFDDTNPAKENVEFEKAILEDLEMLQIKPDRFTHSSDYFDLMLDYCQKLLKSGMAYVDDTPALQMKEQRDQKIPSANRDNSVEKNLELWNLMIQGTEKGQECCVRAKIDYQSANGCLRDPTIYRCKPEPHPRTGNKYKVYPTYDFACPIVDAVENVTHTLRTTEYHDRDEQFYWFIDALKLRRPYIWEYSRLNMTNTVLSKRKLTWFVAEGLVDGWDDPRFPTVRGILRRGMTVEGLKQFIIAQGSSRSVVFMEWDKIWAFNKKVIDPIAIRYTALNTSGLVRVNVKGASEGFITVANHPKDPSIGTKQVKIGPTILIEKEDAEALKENQNATFINWGNLLIEKIKKDNNTIVEVIASLNLENKDYKNTLKLTWLCADKPESTITSVPCYAVYFDHIITKPVLGKDDDFKDFVAKDTRKEVEFIGETELKRVKTGEIIQLQRKGFFRCDVPYEPISAYSSREQPIILFHIPDGHASSVSSSTNGNTSKDSKQISTTEQIKLNDEIVAQGNKIRDLKASKADKAVIQSEVNVLLSLKEKYKNLTGQDWKPSTTQPTSKSTTTTSTTEQIKLNDEIVAQGNKIRDLKASKADKAVIQSEVNVLLSLKEKYKNLTGQDWKPSTTQPTSKSTTATSTTEQIKLNDDIVAQGNKIRDLKASKADKAVIQSEVNVLLSLKEKYKNLTGQDWKPSTTQSTSKSTMATSTTEQIKLNDEIVAQGNKIRDLKASKADKAVIQSEVNVLLSLKEKYKNLTGQDWKPSTTQSTSKSTMATSTTEQIKLNDEIVAQGNKIRDLKASKADKAVIQSEVNVLLSLKEKYKNLTGQDWKPSTTQPTSKSTTTTEPNKSLSSENSSKIITLSKNIDKQNDIVSTMQKTKPGAEMIAQAVAKLIELKNEYKKETGKDWSPIPNEKSKTKAVKSESGKAKKSDNSKDSSNKAIDSNKSGTELGLQAKKSTNLPEWYSQVLTKGEMIEYYNVSGCYILRPWSFEIWEVIQKFFNAEIKKLGVKNCYFPIFVCKSELEIEKTHVEDFAPEVAWVTKSGETDLAEPIAIRPTSETVMYPAYSKWLRSHRDLPLKLNQWSNVVRWEFKHPQPFLRTREFLWQEGHSAFATKAEADEEVLTILDLYARIYEEFLAIPVVKGRKTEKEKFAGGDYTTTVEAFISASGRAIQGGTSHHLGQNFSKMFDIKVEDPTKNNEKMFVYQNSWGLTTRTIGVMVMVHSDDKGLVLPPKVAAVQAIIVPCGITASTSADQREKLLNECSKLQKEISENELVKVEGDLRDNYSPGWKFNYWELKGVPIRVELGPKDLEKGQVTLVRRDTAERTTASRANAQSSIIKLLDEIQSNLYEKAKTELQEHTKQTHNWDEFCAFLDKKNIILAPYCGAIACEEKIKADSVRKEEGDDPNAPSMGAKSLCIPFNQPKDSIDKLKCIHPQCSEKPKFYTLFGRSY